jgi:hypothetical protein
VSSRDEAVADDIEDIKIEGDIDAEERVRQAKLRPGDFNSTKQFLAPLARQPYLSLLKNTYGLGIAAQMIAAESRLVCTSRTPATAAK